MSIPDTSYVNTYLAQTMTNTKAAADLVTGPLNPSSYIDPVLSNIGLDQLPNLDPVNAIKDLVGENLPAIPELSTPLEFFENMITPSDIIGEVIKYVDNSDIIEQIMEIASGLKTVTSYVDNSLRNLTDGNLPDAIKQQVIGNITQSLMDNGGTAALSLYSEVSGILEPFTSGYTESSLSLAIKANQLFGLATQVPSADDAVLTLDTFKEQYDTQSLSISAEFDAAKGEGGGGGGGGGGGTAGKVYRDAFFYRNGIAVAFPETFPPNQIPPEDRAAFYAANLTDDQKFYDTPSSGGGVGLLDTVTSDAPSGEPGSIVNTNNPPTLNLPLPTPESQFKGVDGNWEFESGDTNQFMTAGGRFVSSVEELECEMSVITRDVSEVIVHWSETFTNANLTGSELQQLTGAGGNAYHYIIKRDGSVERGQPLNSTGSASPGHNSYSIQVCLVGGVNVASEETDINGNMGAGSITRTQFNSLHEIFRVFFIQFPGGQALGHGEFDLTQLDPGFEVRDYAYNSFNKVSLYVDPLSESEKSPQEIISGINSTIVLLSSKDTDGMLDNF